ncbi:MAG: hypothetical protein A1D16_05800 [Flavihumibacter sp. CACIAM 22H1]|nr:MAG: hypothetical protein A1D16_05800 [Flavihumibacter sp. CACIAM 22H1]
MMVSSSILAAGPLGEFLKAAYGWEGTVTCRLLRAGINHTYSVEIKDNATQPASLKFVFRVYSLNWRSQSEILAEIGLIQELKEGGLPVSYPLPAKNGSFIVPVWAPEGQRFGLLFSFAEGSKVHRYPMEVHREAGRVMARFHELTKGKKIEREHYDLARLLHQPFQTIALYLSAEAEEMNYLKELASRLEHELSEAAPFLRNGVVHLDIWFENFVITADQQLILFDFDFCGNGWPGLDLAFYSMQVHNSERYEAALYEPNLQAFLEGYQSVLEIPAIERKLLPQLGLALFIFYLGIQCQRFENWSNTFLSEDYLKRFINGLIRRYDLLYSKGAPAPDRALPG